MNLRLSACWPGLHVNNIYIYCPGLTKNLLTSVTCIRPVANFEDCITTINFSTLYVVYLPFDSFNNFFQLSDWWRSVAYLDVREPCVINSNPGVLFPKADFNDLDGQLRWAMLLKAVHLCCPTHTASCGSRVISYNRTNPCLLPAVLAGQDGIHICKRGLKGINSLHLYLHVNSSHDKKKTFYFFIWLLFSVLFTLVDVALVLHYLYCVGAK